MTTPPTALLPLPEPLPGRLGLALLGFVKHGATAIKLPRKPGARNADRCNYVGAKCGGGALGIIHVGAHCILPRPLAARAVVQTRARC